MDFPRLQKTLHVTGLPASITVEDLACFFTREFGPLLEGCRSSTEGVTGLAQKDEISMLEPWSKDARYGVSLHNTGQNEAVPFCCITFSKDAPADVAEKAVMRCAADNRHLTVTEGWTSCVVKLKRETKHHRLQVIRANVAAKAKKQAAIEARRPIWRPEMLDLFPCRESTLDHHVQVSDLSAELQNLVTTYLAFRFPDATSEVADALQWVWQNYPKSLRVKELFETVEAFSLIAQQLDLIRTRGRCSRSRSQRVAGRSCPNGADKACDVSSPSGTDSGPLIETIFDMACGHGLLGILLAYRFADLRVVCVDLERHESFDHYLTAFKTCGIPDNARPEDSPLSNIELVEDDIANVIIPSKSFVICVHACNEANKIALESAQQAQAGYAVIPCCIPDGLYSVQTVRYADVDARYAAMVGAIAGAYGAHSISCIERRITNRHMCIFGGYLFGGMRRGEKESFCTHRHRVRKGTRENHA